MSLRDRMEQALGAAWEVQAAAWGRRVTVADPRTGETWAVWAVWPPQRERTAAAAGGFLLEHDATARWAKETGPAPELGWTVTPAGQGRTFEVVELRETDDVAYAVALRAL